MRWLSALGRRSVFQAIAAAALIASASSGVMSSLSGCSRMTVDARGADTCTPSTRACVEA